MIEYARSGAGTACVSRVQCMVTAADGEEMNKTMLVYYLETTFGSQRLTQFVVAKYNSI